ncbi:MAG: hypothetical protein V3R99_01400 [Thermoguttaceae bacterium]
MKETRLRLGTLMRGTLMILLVAAVPWCGERASAGLPVPKEGLLIRKDRADAVRRELLSLLDEPVVVGKRGIRTVADRAVDDWPDVKVQVEPHIDEILDLEQDRNPKEHVSDDAREAAGRLSEMVDTTAKLGMMYFLTGRDDYARTAYEIIAMAGRVPRWGWFNWEGVNVPQIPFGMYTRNVAFAVDFCWDGWSPTQRRDAVEILAEKGVEHYWRLVSLSPFMGLHHLRSKNQGSNVLSAAVIASLAVGDDVPENRTWLESLLQTYTWIIAHDIGPAGTNLESGLPGYWSVSMQNLYTAAACLNNARGIDLRVHPAIAEATWYPIMKEATVPPHAHGRFDRPYPKDEVGLSGTMEHKPIELPSPSYGGSWWYDYAAQFPESPAMYFISKNFKGRIANAHQEGHSELLDLLWVRTMAEPASVPRPSLRFKATGREAMFRSGYGSPHTFLSFNGDMFLSARNEVLCCTGGLAWHFPWHQYAVTESVLETEGEPFSPSMVVTDSFDGKLLSLIGAESGPSNVSYYARPGQITSHRAYEHRTRKIAYVRSDDRSEVYDYFVFIDRVEHAGRRWHGFNWHIWNSPGNEGRYESIDPGSVLARRPNAAVLLATLSHDEMTYEEQAIPSQPTVAYVFDHNARLLRAIAGRSQPPQDSPVTLPARLWSDGRTVKLDGRDAVLFEDFSRPKEKTPSFRAPLTLQPGCRYRVSLKTRKEDARIYENFSWIINFKLLDRDGKVLLDAADAYSFRDPHPLKLTSPASNLAGYDDWKETATHFTAPADMAAVEATLLPATYGHSTSLKESSKIWLSDMTLTPLGVPVRKDREVIVTLAMPLENDSPLPKIARTNRSGLLEATVTHPDGTSDRIVVEADGALSVTRGTLRYDDRRRPGTSTNSLTTNSPESRMRLKTGMAKLAERLLGERDKYVRRGWKNVAIDAVEVKADRTRDDRFAATNVIDNKTWEVPIDGVVDYTLGPITTTGSGGYGRGPVPYDHNPSTWELYFRPTYWLLPPGQTGRITIKLKEPTRLRLIRLLNTTNAGLNDFAAVGGRLELLADDDTLLWSRDLSFGRPWDRAFQAAFAKPEFFGSYGEAFQGILEPGVIVPFGAGWLEVPVDLDSKVRSIRLRIDKYWAMGGGVNEIQAYAAPAP